MQTFQNPTIRRFCEKDIPFAISLTDHERWGNVPEDFQRYLSLFPGGSFIAEIDDCPVGMITTATFAHLGFLGNLIVEPEMRGKGIGESLLTRAIKHLDDKNCRTLELDGDYPAVNLYRRLGFKDKYLSLRFFRPPDKSEKPTGNFDNIEIELALRLDKSLTNLDRSAYLGDILGLYPDHLITDNPTSPESFGLIRPRSAGFHQIGPVLAHNSSAAQRIISSLTRTYSNKTIKVGVGENHRDAVAIYRELGFLTNPPSLRMYMGEKLDYENNIFAIISGDVG